MKRSLIRRLAAALRQAVPGRWWYTTCLLRLPPAWSATAPVWSPDPIFGEVHTAEVWARPAGGGTARAVVVCYDDTRPVADAEVLAEADVATMDVIRPGGLCDKPHRIRHLAIPGSLSTFPLHGSHPLLAYRGWRDRLAGQLDDLLRTRRHRRGLRGDGIRLRRTPEGGFLAATSVLVDPHPDRFRHDIAAHAATLAAAARVLGADTRLSFCHDDDPQLDPLYHHARAWLLAATPS